MDKIIFCIATILICGYLWIESHNQKQKQNFHHQIITYENKAKQGDLNAQKLLADLYARGADLIIFDSNNSNSSNGKNLHNSAYWYEQSALQGDIESQFAIANIYENGIGIDKNLQNANYWYYQASMQGNAPSQYRLAQNFEHGKGVIQSYPDAMYWYLKLAEQGDKKAIYKVGVIYDDGLWDFPEDDKLALFWLDKLDPNDKNSPFDLRSRLLILHNPINLSKIQITQQAPQTQYINHNCHLLGWYV